MYKQNQSKGSTLLLAMIVISTVLFAGIGVGTILSRQIRDIRTLEDSAAAFYARETGVDAGDATESWKDLDWDGVEPKSAYREKNGNIEGKSGSVRWAMGEAIEIGNGEISGITVYFNHEGAHNPPIYTQYELDGGSSLSGEMTHHEENWYKFLIENTEGYSSVDIRFQGSGFGATPTGDYSWDILKKGEEVRMYHGDEPNVYEGAP